MRLREERPVAAQCTNPRKLKTFSLFSHEAVGFSLHKPHRMEKGRNKIPGQILNFALEIIYLLTGEDCTVVKKSSRECVSHHVCHCVSGGWSRSQSPIMEPPPQSLILEYNDQKILDLTNKMIELLTGEEDDLIDVKVLEDDDDDDDDEAYVMGDQQFKEEEIPLKISPADDQSKTFEGHDSDIQNYQSENPIAANICPGLHVADLSFDSSYDEGCSDKSHIIQQNADMFSESEECSTEELGHLSQERMSEVEKTFLCPECGQHFAQQAGFIEHLKTHEECVEGLDSTPVKKHFPCLQCQKHFTKKSLLIEHQRIHTGEKPFPCSQCGKCFTKKSNLVKHWRIHTGEKPFLCSDCGRCFTNKSDLVKHYRIHTGEKPYSCSSCGKCFTQKSGLIEHQKIHTGEKPFSCSECGKCFTFKSGLIDHQRSHSGERPFECTECGKCFTRKSFLFKHKKGHLGEKPYPCLDCGKCFAKKSNLVQHQRIHTGEKPFSCLECGRCFTQKSALVEHQRIHKGDKPFICSDCGKCFTQKSYLFRHQRTHTGNKNRQMEELLLNLVVLIYSRRMDKRGNNITQRILNLTLEIFYLLAGEDYIVVKKTSGEYVTSGEWSKTMSPIIEPSPYPPVLEGYNEQKILDLTNKMIELLTGEVPIRCQDVTVHFSMEEWEYIEGHKELYKDVMMEDHKLLISPEGSNKNNPERCRSPLFFQACSTENPSVPENHQDKDLPEIKAEVMNEEEETYESCNHMLKTVEIPTDINADDYSNTSKRHYNDISKNSLVEHPTTQNTYSGLYFPELSWDFSNHEEGPEHILPQSLSSESVDCFTEESDQFCYERTENVDNLFPCLECGQCFSHNANLLVHLRIHKKSIESQKNTSLKRLFSCLQCGKCFTRKSVLNEHLRTHTGEKPHSCLQCGKCFTKKSSLLKHEVIHTGEKLFSCLECGKCFMFKDHLERHQRIHTGERPYPCSECGKCFIQKSGLSKHQKIHTGEKPFSCSECGKCFAEKSGLVRHQRTHTGEKPYSCSECGKCFAQKSELVEHHRNHTGEKPFLCLECGQSFSRKSVLANHQRIHRGTINIEVILAPRKSLSDESHGPLR
ncbi:uncharacterized protein ACNLHF_021154 [Anomaloglossus baeobatrachus]